MSTRCVINFYYNDGVARDEEVAAKVYRHCDGYPDGTPGVPACLERFFTEVEAQCTGTMYGTRFNDPSYLAAKFIVWQANEYHQEKMLAFGSLGVVQKNPGDIEYEYFVACGRYGRPRVAWRQAGTSIFHWDHTTLREKKEDTATYRLCNLLATS